MMGVGGRISAVMRLIDNLDFLRGCSGVRLFISNDRRKQR